MIKKFSIVIVISVAFASYSNADFCSIRSCSPRSHTLCKFPFNGPSSSCNDLGGGLSDNDKTAIVNKHNELRQRVAKGLESRGSPGPQPRARNMPNLVWDNQLAYVAQRWADQCGWGHDQCRSDDRFYVGQNIYKSWTTGDVNDLKVLGALDSWYNEVQFFDRNDVSNYKGSTSRSGKVIGHYTQLVWARTTRIGCGLRKFRDGRDNVLYLVCNYGPGGNMPGERVY